MVDITLTERGHPLKVTSSDSPTTSKATRATPRSTRRSDGRRGFVRPVEESNEPFDPPQVHVIIARKKNTVWHIITCRVAQTRPNRSGVHVLDDSRIASASSNVQASKSILDLSRERGVMSVLPPDGERTLFEATCPTHGAVRRNSTIEYAIESAYWHATEHES